MKNKQAIGILTRYIFLIVLGLFGFSFLYKTLAPITVYPVFSILNILYNDVVFQSPNVLLISGDSIVLVEACIAGAAYFLLLILNLTTPLSIKTRAKSLAFIFISFLLLNIIRIVVFTFLYLSWNDIFNITHMLFWYIGSTILLVFIWFFNVYLFKIKSTPIYTDMREIYKDAIKRSKSTKKGSR